MGRTKGVKNKNGHKAGGARKGSGRKPKSIEDSGSKKQTIGFAPPLVTRNSRKPSTKPNFDDNRLANLLPAPASISTTQHDPNTQPYRMITPAIYQERHHYITYTPGSSAAVACLPLPLQLTSKEPYHISPANPWSTDRGSNLPTQPDSVFSRDQIMAVKSPSFSYTTASFPQSQPATYTPISSPMCSAAHQGSYSQFERNYWDTPQDSQDISDTDGVTVSLMEANAGVAYYSPSLPYSSYSPWPNSHVTLSSPSQQSPASSYSSLESPATSSPSSLQTTKPRRRPRRCAVCLTYGEDLNALTCPGRGDRNRCPHSRVFDTLAMSHGDAIENFSFQPRQPAVPRDDSNLYAKYADDSITNTCLPFAVSTFENAPRQPRHCKICTATGRAGTTCPGRGNRALCPDFNYKNEH